MTELHILSLAAITARTLTVTSSANLIDKPSELLLSSVNILNILLPKVLNKEILKIFRDTFLSNNLLYLRIH